MLKRLKELCGKAQSRWYRLRPSLGLRPMYHLKRGQALSVCYNVFNAKAGPTITTWHFWGLAKPEAEQEWKFDSDLAAYQCVAEVLLETGGTAFLVHKRTGKRIGQIDVEGQMRLLQSQKGRVSVIAKVFAGLVALVTIVSGLTGMFGTTVQQFLDRLLS